MHWQVQRRGTLESQGPAHEMGGLSVGFIRSSSIACTPERTSTGRRRTNLAPRHGLDQSGRAPVPSPGDGPHAGPLAAIGRNWTGAIASLLKSLREDEEVVPVNVSTWVLLAGATVRR